MSGHCSVCGETGGCDCHRQHEENEMTEEDVRGIVRDELRRDRSQQRENDVRPLSQVLPHPHREADRWRSIDTAPKDGTRILAVETTVPFIARWADKFAPVFDDGEHAGWFHAELGRRASPTRWQPLPELRHTLGGLTNIEYVWRVCSGVDALAAISRARD